MSHRLSLFALAAAVLAVPLARRASQPTVHPQQKGAPSAGVLQLRNTGQQPIKVEIGVAHDGDCAAKAVPVRTLTVPAGGSWQVRSTQPLCVRQEKPDVGGQQKMQGWEQKKPASGQVEEVVL